MTTSQSTPEIRGTRIRVDHGHAKIETVTAHRWTQEDEEAFLDTLACTANVRAAAREVGFSTMAIYARRRRDAAFAAKWQAALAQGVARIQAALVRTAADSMEGVEFDDDRPIPKMSVDQVLNLMKLHGHILGLCEPHQRRTIRRRPLEDMKDSLLRKAQAARVAHPDE